MKEHQIQAIAKDRFVLNGISEELALGEVLSKHDIGKNDIITLVLGGDISQVALSYDIYQKLKGLGFGNIDFKGSIHPL